MPKSFGLLLKGCGGRNELFSAALIIPYHNLLRCQQYHLAAFSTLRLCVSALKLGERDRINRTGEGRDRIEEVFVCFMCAFVYLVYFVVHKEVVPEVLQAPQKALPRPLLLPGDEIIVEISFEFH